jgi:hypothetical protein
MVARLLGPDISRRNLCLIMAIMLGIFISIQAPGVSNDYMNYKDWYLGTGSVILGKNNPFMFEWIFYKLMGFCSSINIPFPAFLALLTITSMYIKLFVISKLSIDIDGFLIIFFIYCTTFYLLHDFTQIRTGMAISILFYATWQLMQGHRGYFYSLVLIASGFHMSALLAIPLSIFAMRQTRAINWILIGVTMAFMLFRIFEPSLTLFMSNIVSSWDPRLAFYVSIAASENATQANSFSITALLLFGVAASILASDTADAHVNRNDLRRIVPLARCLLIALWPILLFPELHEIASRIYEFISTVVILLGAIILSNRKYIFPKILLLSWGVATLYVFIFRADPLVRPYSLNWP